MTLYFILYNEIDDRTIKQEESARNTAKLLIMNTYEGYLKTLEIVNNKRIIRGYVVSKVDFYKTDKNNVVIHNFKILPFETFNRIMSLAESGCLSKKEFSHIILIKIVLLRVYFFSFNNGIILLILWFIVIDKVIY